jgi:DNA-binding CsgD family transcriptional regulator
MGRPPKITGALREELWRRYKAGETVLGIGRALDQRQATLHRLLQATGGIAPTHRSRSSRVLSFSEREEISRGVAAGYTFHAIARGLHRAVSTVSQEVARHGGRPHYRAAPADSAAWESARRPKRCLLAKNPELRRIVAGKLKQDSFRPSG